MTIDQIITNKTIVTMLQGALDTMLDVATCSKAGINISIEQAGAYLKSEQTAAYCIDRLLEVNINIDQIKTITNG
jgi:hypothetical protein